MARYPVFDRDNLSDANPFKRDMQDAIDELEDAQSDWYNDREDLFRDYGVRNISRTKVEAKYDQVLGEKNGDNRPWKWKEIIEGFSLNRRSRNDDDDRWVKIGTKDLGIVSSIYLLYERDDFSWDEIRDDGDQVIVVRYEPGRGKGQLDILYEDAPLFTGGSKPYENRDLGIRVLDDEDADIISLNEHVRSGFGETPIAWEKEGNYTDVQIHIMNAAYPSFEDAVRPYISAYEDARDLYEGAGGKPLEGDFFQNPPASWDIPWDGIELDSTRYNKPGPLKDALVRLTRGVE
jgi:hypothetical protein